MTVSHIAPIAPVSIGLINDYQHVRPAGPTPAAAAAPVASTPASPAPPVSPGATSATTLAAASTTYAHPGLDPVTMAQRAARGRIAENTPDVMPQGVIEKGAPSYFRTYEQMKTALYDLQTKYPTLVKVTDIGDSYEKTKGKADRDILALTITNSAVTGPKAKVEEIAGVHAREIANPEMLMTWATQLLDGFGRDPEATALLNTREINLIPMVNPDGHAFIERAYAGKPDGDMMKRKNASGVSGEGTDVNRNFGFHWGGPGASSSPGNETYRGATAASEPETQAVQEFTKNLKANVFTDWHSYSKLDMYPWGDTKVKAPDYVGLKAVAEKMATMNHYSPMQSVALYPTTGTTDDNAYGAYGIPSWAVETGDSFHQDDKEYAQTLAENLPVLQYEAKIASNPYDLVQGPDATDVLVDPQTHVVSARVTDATSGNNSIAGAELLLDPNAAAGSGTPLLASDGKFNTATETVTGNITLPASATAQDGQLVYVHAKDIKGNWGPLTAQWLVGPKDQADHS